MTRRAASLAAVSTGLGLALFAFAPPARTASRASFKGLGTLDPTAAPAGSWASGVSGDGRTVVGTSYVFDGTSTQTRAFVWTAKKGMTDLGLPAGSLASASASGVSDDGSLVSGADGFTIGGALEIRNAVYWSQTGGTPFSKILAEGLAATDVSGDGRIVTGATRIPAPWPVVDKGFALVGLGTMHKIDTLPGGSYSWLEASSKDGSVFAGWADTPDAITAVRWSRDAGLQRLAGQAPGVPSQANGISADGRTIVGTVNVRAFAWTETGLLRMLGELPGGTTSTASDVSGNGGTIVGTADADGRASAVVWDGAAGPRAIKDIAENDFGLDLTGWSLQAASAVSDDGRTITGWGINPSGLLEAWVFRRPASGPAVRPASFARPTPRRAALTV